MSHPEADAGKWHDEINLSFNLYFLETVGYKFNVSTTYKTKVTDDDDDVDDDEFSMNPEEYISELRRYIADPSLHQGDSIVIWI